jgi:hypothetical protein
MEKKLKNIRKEVSGCQIQYLIIDNFPSIAPSNFYHTVFSFLRAQPTNLLQLAFPESFYMGMLSNNIFLGPNIFHLTSEFFMEEMATDMVFKYISNFNSDIVKVFLINRELDIDFHKKMRNIISKLPVAYVLLIGGNENSTLEYDSHLILNELFDLSDYIKRDWQKISNVLYDFRGESLPEKFIYKTTFSNPYYNIKYCNSNYFILNQIIGNGWNGNMEIVESPVELRIKQMVTQISTIDACYLIARSVGYATMFEPSVQPIVLIAPFHSPIRKKELVDRSDDKVKRKILNVYNTEQDKDYQFTLNASEISFLEDEKTAGLILVQLAKHLEFLDKIGYLHASFTSSPILRLPIIGNSIYADLSHLLRSFPSRIAVTNKIKNVAKIIKEKIFHDEFLNIINKRNGQIVAISDLPIEWVCLEESFPLSFTHDVCRIPEYNINSMANIYIHHNRNSFKISSLILQKTLIIQCASEQDEVMNEAFEKLISVNKAFGAAIVRCKSIIEIKQAIDSFDPHLLIFDCHGNFDAKNSESYLVIDAKKDLRLRGQDVVDNEISAPLVFISACNTHPNFGFSKHLTDAFCEVGAFSVTATYLPIPVKDATNLIENLLMNLKIQKSQIFHHNWLSLIAYTFRLSTIMEFLSGLVEKGKIKGYEFLEVNEILLKLHCFNGRRTVIKDLVEFLKVENPDLPDDTFLQGNEFLAYTTIGRPDLIFFENWEFKNKEVFDRALMKINEKFVPQ